MEHNCEEERKLQIKKEGKKKIFFSLSPCKKKYIICLSSVLRYVWYSFFPLPLSLSPLESKHCFFASFPPLPSHLHFFSYRSRDFDPTFPIFFPRFSYLFQCFLISFQFFLFLEPSLARRILDFFCSPVENLKISYVASENMKDVLSKEMKIKNL